MLYKKLLMVDIHERYSPIHENPKFTVASEQMLIAMMVPSRWQLECLHDS